MSDPNMSSAPGHLYCFPTLVHKTFDPLSRTLSVKVRPKVCHQQSSFSLDQQQQQHRSPFGHDDNTSIKWRLSCDQSNSLNFLWLESFTSENFKYKYKLSAIENDHKVLIKDFDYVGQKIKIGNINPDQSVITIRISYPPEVFGLRPSVINMMSYQVDNNKQQHQQQGSTTSTSGAQHNHHHNHKSNNGNNHHCDHHSARGKAESDEESDDECLSRCCSRSSFSSCRSRYSGSGSGSGSSSSSSSGSESCSSSCSCSSCTGSSDSESDQRSERSAILDTKRKQEYAVHSSSLSNSLKITICKSAFSSPSSQQLTPVNNPSSCNSAVSSVESPSEAVILSPGKSGPSAEDERKRLRQFRISRVIRSNRPKPTDPIQPSSSATEDQQPTVSPVKTHHHHNKGTPDAKTGKPKGSNSKHLKKEKRKKKEIRKEAEKAKTSSNTQPSVIVSCQSLEQRTSSSSTAVSSTFSPVVSCSHSQSKISMSQQPLLVCSSGTSSRKKTRNQSSASSLSQSSSVNREIGVQVENIFGFNPSSVVPPPPHPPIQFNPLNIPLHNPLTFSPVVSSSGSVLPSIGSLHHATEPNKQLVQLTEILLNMPSPIASCGSLTHSPSILTTSNSGSLCSPGSILSSGILSTNSPRHNLRSNIKRMSESMFSKALETTENTLRRLKLSHNHHSHSHHRKPQTPMTSVFQKKDFLSNLKNKSLNSPKAGQIRPNEERLPLKKRHHRHIESESSTTQSVSRSVNSSFINPSGKFMNASSSSSTQGKKHSHKQQQKEKGGKQLPDPASSPDLMMTTKNSSSSSKHKSRHPSPSVAAKISLPDVQIISHPPKFESTVDQVIYDCSLVPVESDQEPYKPGTQEVNPDDHKPGVDYQHQLSSTCTKSSSSPSPTASAVTEPMKKKQQQLVRGEKRSGFRSLSLQQESSSSSLVSDSVKPVEALLILQSSASSSRATSALAIKSSSVRQQPVITESIVTSPGVVSNSSPQPIIIQSISTSSPPESGLSMGNILAITDGPPTDKPNDSGIVGPGEVFVTEETADFLPPDNGPLSNGGPTSNGKSCAMKKRRVNRTGWDKIKKKKPKQTDSQRKKKAFKSKSAISQTVSQPRSMSLRAAKSIQTRKKHTEKGGYANAASIKKAAELEFLDQGSPRSPKSPMVIGAMSPSRAKSPLAAPPVPD